MDLKISKIEIHIFSEGPRIEHYSEAEDEWNWRPLVDLFLKEELGQEKKQRRRDDSAGTGESLVIHSVRLIN